MSGHTPGPWEIVNATDVFTKLGATSAEGTEAAHNDGWRIADCASIPTTNKDGEQCELSFREAHANARLIAAAPELLEALRPFAALDLRPDGFDKRDDSQPVYARDKSVITVGDVRRAVAAIAKATGANP